MRLPRIVGTSSFRVTLLYAALFCISSIALFAVVYWSTTGFMDQQIDDTVAGEIQEIETDAPVDDLPKLTATVEAFSSRSPSFFYLLQDAQGQRLAGNLPPMAPTPGLHEQRRAVTSAKDRVKRIRGRGVALPGGAYLFVAVNAYEVHEMREQVERAFFWSLGITILLALAGGAVMSLSVLGRVEALSRVSREIVTGDLDRRIKLRGSNDEFDHLATSLNAMFDRIQGLMEGMRQVSTDIAHDLRTPLTRLRQRVERAIRKADDVETLRAALQGTLHDLDGVLDTFGALLRIAQIEASARTAAFGVVDLTETLRTVVEVYLPVAEETRRHLVDAIAPGLSTEGDRELLLQLFANLVENAIRHAPEGAHVAVRATAVDGQVEVIVSDDGPGIPAPLREKVFERFYRLETSRTSPGNGLGLSLVAAVAALHNARVELADNAPGLRATIRLLSISPA